MASFGKDTLKNEVGQNLEIPVGKAESVSGAIGHLHLIT